MPIQAMGTQNDEVARRVFMPDSSLAERSLELYDYLGENYLHLDRCRGDDIDVIAKEVSRYPQGCRIFDAGCGPGKHIEYCSQLPFVQEVKGVDFSVGMIEAALHRAVDIPRNASVSFQVHDLLEPLENADVFDIILCMNNVLGNVLSHNNDTAENDRERFLKNLQVVMKPTGLILFSVFMRSHLQAKCPHSEEKGFNISDKSCIETGDLVINFSPIESIKLEYYSHWFTKTELIDLLSNSGLVIRTQRLRPPRLILVVQQSDSASIHS